MLPSVRQFNAGACAASGKQHKSAQWEMKHSSVVWLCCDTSDEGIAQHKILMPQLFSRPMWRPQSLDSAVGENFPFQHIHSELFFLPWTPQTKNIPCLHHLYDN